MPRTVVPASQLGGGGVLVICLIQPERRPPASPPSEAADRLGVRSVRFDVCLPNEEHLILLRYACGAGWRMYGRLPPHEFSFCQNT